jgi:hypothetical protein
MEVWGQAWEFGKGRVMGIAVGRRPDIKLNILN